MSGSSHIKRKLQKRILYDQWRGRAPQITAYGGNAGTGKVFWVNSSTGSDSAYGQVPTSPFATITYALTKCTDRNDDTIIVVRDPSEAAYPVVINKRDIHILAWDRPTRPGADKIYMASGGSAACFQIAAQNVEIAGFDFVADASYPGINFANASYWNASVHDCSFGRRGAVQDGIHLEGVSRDAAYMTIYNNYFAGGCARDGVRITGAMTYGWITNNIFHSPVEVCINQIANTSMAAILDNRMALTASFSAGDAITMTGSGCIVDGNIAMYLVETTWSNNPYVENGANHWGHNERSDEGVNLPA